MATMHPDPLLERPHWVSLDGEWQFAFDDDQRWRVPADVPFDRVIQVPFPPESAASGIHDQGYHPALWYRLLVRPETLPGEPGRLLLHFGAVDYQATVWVNGQRAAEHQGGHTPFCADVTDLLRPGEPLEITLRAEDDPHDLAKPRGKQAWEREPHEIWYPRTSGIWQTVWLERRPQVAVGGLVWTADVARWSVNLSAHVEGPLQPGLQLRVRLMADDLLLADDRYAVLGREVNRTVQLQDPGIDAARRLLMWTPEHPQLIQATVELVSGDRVLDRVSSYTAMRSVSVDRQHFLLNGRPYTLKMVLDQGYWPDTLLAATDEQLRHDVELTRLLGFNGARKHQKIESPRYLYWADVLGLLVWEELPSAYSFSAQAARRLTQEWTEAILRDRSHPCIVAWVPINESWGVPDLPVVPAQRDLTRALYHLTRTLDPTRPVIGNDGWEFTVTDIIAIHDYSHKPQTLLDRYETREAARRTVMQERPHRRMIALDPQGMAEQPMMLTEFGGIAFSRDDDLGWGYNRRTDAEGFLSEYVTLLEAVHACEGLIGFCYTQLADTFQEKNGLLFEDRTPKAAVAALAQANRGERSAQEVEHDPALDPMGYDHIWRKKRGADAPPAGLPSIVNIVNVD